MRLSLILLVLAMTVATTAAFLATSRPPVRLQMALSSRSDDSNTPSNKSSKSDHIFAATAKERRENVERDIKRFGPTPEHMFGMLFDHMQDNRELKAREEQKRLQREAEAAKAKQDAADAEDKWGDASDGQLFFRQLMLHQKRELEKKQQKEITPQQIERAEQEWKQLMDGMKEVHSKHASERVYHKEEE